jgi:hypothetical protein
LLTLCNWLAKPRKNYEINLAELLGKFAWVIDYPQGVSGKILSLREWTGGLIKNSQIEKITEFAGWFGHLTPGAEGRSGGPDEKISEIFCCRRDEAEFTFSASCGK